MSKDTGGPAFPINNDYMSKEGMSLRDYLAAHAPAVPDDFGWVKGENDFASRLVRWNYQYADMMLNERVK